MQILPPWNPEISRVKDPTGKSFDKWLLFYRVEHVVNNLKYIIRKTGTNFIQNVRRTRIRTFTLQYTVDNLPQRSPSNFDPDPNIGIISQPGLLDNALP